MEIRNLEHTDFDTLFNAFERAFADYEVHFDKKEVRSMLLRRGYVPWLSFAAFDNGEIVAFTLNGIGIFNGIPTAYDTGTGTVKEYRGQGIAREIFSYSLPFLKESGIRQYLLEVLQNNSNAIAIYRRMRFNTTREFACYRQSIDKINISAVADNDCIIKPVEMDFIRQAQSFCDFTPSWQNSIESIERGEAELKFLGATIGEMLVGYCVFDPATGDLSQIAVRDEYRRRGIASILLQEAIRCIKTDFVKVLNISADNQVMPAFLERNNILLASRQFEMLLQIS